MLILASQSPQRKRLLEKMGYEFKVVHSSYEEMWNKKISVEDNVKIFAEKKAQDVLSRNPDNIVIGCDTFVVHPKKGVYLKPKNKEEARKMLKSYSNQIVKVLSGICVMSKKRKDVRLVETDIVFAKIPSNLIEWWLKQNEWEGRSGAASIEGAASRFVKEIHGCFFNIIGLPTQVLDEMLKKFWQK